jgi:hypothetical protein
MGIRIQSLGPIVGLILEFHQKDHRLNTGMISIARTTVRKGSIIKKNGREQGKEHEVSYYVILINNVSTALSRTLYYKKEINK